MMQPTPEEARAELARRQAQRPAAPVASAGVSAEAARAELARRAATRQPAAPSPMRSETDAIINEANNPNSIIRSVSRIGKDINLVGKKAVTVTNTAIEQLIGRPTVQPMPSQQFELGVQEKPVLTTREEQTVVNLIVEAIKENERRVVDVPNLEALIKPDVQERIAKKVTEAYETTYQPVQAEFV